VTDGPLRYPTWQATQLSGGSASRPWSIDWPWLLVGLGVMAFWTAVALVLAAVV
jgi:hypothetical protein